MNLFLSSYPHHGDVSAYFDTCFFFSDVKIEVNGENASPLYKFLKEQKGGLFGDSIKWNFAKFLVDKEGNVVDRYAPTTSPLEIEVSPSFPHPHTLIFVSLTTKGSV